MHARLPLRRLPTELLPHELSRAQGEIATTGGRHRPSIGQARKSLARLARQVIGTIR